MGRALFRKIWDEHVVADLGDGFALLHVDRHVLHDLGGRALVGINKHGLKIRNPELTFATADHTVSTAIRAAGESAENDFIRNLRENAEQHGFRFFDPHSREHGIVHVIVPDLGIALPGMTLACGDSHTCTIGALGVVSWGVGQSEIVHILATQTSVQRLPKTMRIRIEGQVPAWITPKDIILQLIGRVGASGGVGHAVEFAGSVVRDMPMEGRFTLCNMAVEFGARFGMIAPDETTLAYVSGRPGAPKGADWARAAERWRALRSDDDAPFDRDILMDVTELQPQITWGTSPEHVIPVTGRVPDPASVHDPFERATLAAALDYARLTPGARLEKMPVDWVFIGSCTNSRISDLRLAAKFAAGRKVAPGVTAWVVPGSNQVKEQAEAEGLDRVFKDAGFDWRNSGCSMCGGTGNAMRERVGNGQRCVSTSNRNFVGRQGPGSHTMLASPPMAVAAAVTGCVTDVRKLAGP
jgi:3-isopropylmalate/(R)-2-methylmalate dehydratase large subunit